MQETTHYDNLNNDMSQEKLREMLEQQQKIRREFFEGFTNKEVFEKMDKEIPKGHTVLSRIPIGRNDICPCGSSKKFKNCCIDKVR